MSLGQVYWTGVPAYWVGVLALMAAIPSVRASWKEQVAASTPLHSTIALIFTVVVLGLLSLGWFFILPIQIGYTVVRAVKKEPIIG